ncbi:prolyl 3-hydroxylase OGFOD1-like [Fopius arisanus]|uniref:uS12 prolyl 3-hydroxylase n=1 Tax=Fopius arisanus TaxID=64838 RepID=A0A9R1T104_9HYME|nr:PREDICTED: prolyl 3-hydroxylase OGFOD1-like [Fopius arisanus]
MTENEPKSKKFRASILNESMNSIAIQFLFKSWWHSYSPCKATALEVIVFPFRVCKISNFLKCEKFLENLKSELSAIETNRLESDLFSFEQTSDLANVDTENIRQLHQVFVNDLRLWIKTNTGIDLTRKISMSSTRYSDTDHLLCHEDNLGDRRIAFILYLSESWTAEDGGTLDLFSTDSHGLPKKIVRSLIPEYNSLVFFEVSDNSYHQVAEVISPDKLRLTINGWFHGPLKRSNRPPRPEIELILYEPSPNDEALNSWVMQSYLSEDTRREIQNEVENKSYTYLANFLKEDAYNKISAEITSEGINWKRVGPADSRNYEVADEESLPSALKKFYELFKSIEMFKLLKDYTDLDLVPDGKDMKPKMRIELQRWSKGCYTLISDKDTEEPSKIHDSSSRKDNVEVESQGKDVDNSADNPGEEKSQTPSDSPDSQGVEIENSSPDASGNAGSGDDIDTSDTKLGTLDVIIQFNTTRVPEDVTINYVCPEEPDGTLVHVPPEDNHLCLVYRTTDTCRVHKYVKHYCEGYFYNLICSYYESEIPVADRFR